jgi:hypothetical protein
MEKQDRFAGLYQYLFFKKTNYYNTILNCTFGLAAGVCVCICVCVCVCVCVRARDAAHVHLTHTHVCMCVCVCVCVACLSATLLTAVFSWLQGTNIMDLTQALRGLLGGLAGRMCSL